MRLKDLAKITANFFAVLLLVGLLLTPLLFAKNFAKVAGVKSQSQYLIVSQVEKFPNISLTQNQDTYTLTFTKYSESQAFLQVLILNNPTDKTHSYEINASGEAKVFFGEDLNDIQTEITVPAMASVPISLVSENTDELQKSVGFTIKVK